jgi:SAM-dependent methyltransferase
MPHTTQDLFQTELDLLKGRNRHPHLHQLLPFLKKRDPVLDLGCGLLVNSLYLKYNGFKPVGMDISIQMLQEGENIEIPSSCGDGRMLPFKPKSFGGLLLIDIIEHLPRGKVDEFIREAKRVLKNDAVIFLHVPLEKSLSYRLLNMRSIIWPKNPNHQYDYTLKEITSIIKEMRCKVLWEHKENGFVYSLRNHLKEIKPLVAISTFLGRYWENSFTAAYTACLRFETKTE